MMPNRFNGTSDEYAWFIEPPRVSLEGALDRALGPEIQAFSIGGGWDCFGMGRLAGFGNTADEEGASWRKVARMLMEQSQFVLMVPSASEGVRWEVGQLASLGLLAHTLWIMPPADAFPSGELEWERARNGLSDLDIELPPFQNLGALVLLDSKGQLKNVEPFEHVWTGGLKPLIERQLWRGLPPREPASQPPMP
jgi:hypothetical protein